MSGPTRQRSLRERLHGVIPWQGRKSKTFHSKEEQALTESETKPGSLDSRSCDPIPSSGEEEKVIRTSTNGNTASTNSDSKLSSSPSVTQAGETQTKAEDKSLGTKDPSQGEKRHLHRSFTQPKGTEEYQVQASDTLASVAARYDTTPSELAKLNKLTARMIFPGQLLFVPEKKTNSTIDLTSQSESGNNASLSNKDKKTNGEQSESTSQKNNKSEAHEDNSSIPKRKVSVTDALRIPYRRHSDRIQRFLKVKARHFTDGQGVVAGVLIITPNAVMFDPNVSDPLVIEHGIESYGVIAPLDMVMRTAIYFDIAHMKVKNAPEAPLNIPKPDIYYGKMSANNTNNGGSTNNSLQSQKGSNGDPEADTSDNTVENSRTDEEVQAKGNEKDQEDVSKTEESTNAIKGAQISKSSDALATISSDQAPNEVAKMKKGALSREGSLDKEVTEAFANQETIKKIAPTTPNNSIDSPTPPLSAGSITEDRPIPESRRERMLKRLSYPMESITSYTQSSLSRILSSSPKSFVDGLFVKASEDEKNKDELQEAEEEEGNEAPPQGDQQEPVEQETRETEAVKQPEVKQPAETQPTAEMETSKSEVSSVGYKNLVEERPEMFELLDKLLHQNAVQEQEGPPLYLCLRMGLPKQKRMQVTPILSYGKKKAKSEYWFSIPHNRVEDIYNFLQQWFPHLYGDINEKDPEELGFDPIDDSAEDEEEENDKNGESKEEKAECEEEKRSTPMSFLKLVEDHFGFRSISPTDWEVLSMGEEERICFADLEDYRPELEDSSEILDAEHIDKLHSLVPASVIGHSWIRLYATNNDGFNMKTMYRKVSEYEKPIILVIHDTGGATFGAVLTNTLKPSDRFYGSGESFLFTFHPEFKAFRSTGANTYFIKADTDSLVFGAGDGVFGLWIDGELDHGRSQRCLTFDNDVLSSSSDFIISCMEIWGFTPLL